MLLPSSKIQDFVLFMISLRTVEADDDKWRYRPISTDPAEPAEPDRRPSAHTSGVQEVVVDRPLL